VSGQFGGYLMRFDLRLARHVYGLAREGFIGKRVAL
jgi:hypothetical protein